MLWLIQHDFLEGKDAQTVVKEVLSLVPNPNADPEIEQLNSIRTSLHSVARNSSGWSLPQPHIERTRLCNLTDAELNPKYISAREGLKGLVKSLVRPKMMGGKRLTGSQLAKLVGEFTTVLNGLEIPSVSSMVEVFNHELSTKALKGYRSRLEWAKVPSDEVELESMERKARIEAMAMFRHKAIGGRKKAGERLSELTSALDQEFELVKLKHKAASAEVCDREESACESELDEAQAMVFPSLRVFNSTYMRCHASFKSKCRGPASVKEVYLLRLERAYARSSKSFRASYNVGLHTGLVFLSLCTSLFFRFVVRLVLLESIGWLSFLTLEIYPHLLFKGPSSFYQTRGWQVVMLGWETLNWVLFGFYGAWVLWLVLVLAGLARYLSVKESSRRKKSIAMKGSNEERDLQV